MKANDTIITIRFKKWVETFILIFAKRQLNQIIDQNGYTDYFILKRKYILSIVKTSYRQDNSTEWFVYMKSND